MAGSSWLGTIVGFGALDQDGELARLVGLVVDEEDDDVIVCVSSGGISEPLKATQKTVSADGREYVVEFARS